jgi:uncharacterized coiled-coil protein SlyX
VQLEITLSYQKDQHSSDQVSNFVLREMRRQSQVNRSGDHAENSSRKGSLTLSKEAVEQLTTGISEMMLKSQTTSLVVTEIPAQLQAEMKMLNTGMIGLSRDMERLESRTTRLTTQLDRHTVMIEQLMAKVARLEGEVKDQGVRVDGVVDNMLQVRLTDGDGERNEIKSQMTVAPLSDLIAIQSDELDQMQEQIKEYDEKFKSMDDKMSKLLDVIRLKDATTKLKLRQKKSWEFEDL